MGTTIIEDDRDSVKSLDQTTTPSTKETPSITYSGATPQPRPSSHSHFASSPGPRKRVMFSRPSSSTSALREELPADVYNNPSFVFLQLYHSSSLGVQSRDPPILLSSSESVERGIKVLDHIPPYNTHKLGVVYVGEDQVMNVVLCLFYNNLSCTV